MPKSLLPVVVLLLLTHAAYAQQMTRLADSLRQQMKLPAVGFAIVGTEGVVEMGVSGSRRADTLASVQPDDFWHLGSNTKAVTAFVAGKMVDDGKIRWETKFFDLFAGWKTGSDSAYFNITLAQLLSHRAGIRPFTNGAEYVPLPRFEGTTPQRREAFARHVLSLPPLNRNPSVFDRKNNSYSNAGYSLAALMLEKVSRKTYEELVEDLARALEIEARWGFPNRYNDHQPYGHHWATGLPMPPDHPYGLDPIVAPAGDLSLRLPDYARFIAENLRGLKGLPGYLRPETVQYIHTALPDYALGWAVFSIGGLTLSSHDGSAGTFFCHVLLAREPGRALITVSNTAAPKVGVFNNKLDMLLLSRYLR